MNLQIKSKVKQILTSDLPFTDKVSYRKTILLNTMLLFLLFVLLFLTIFNLITLHHYTTALFDFIAFVFTLEILGDFKRNNNIQRTSILTSIIIDILLILFVSNHGQSHLGIIWLIFVPFVNILPNGKNIGLTLSIIIYSYFYYLAYEGLGLWNDGYWNYTDLIRLMLSTSILTALVYLMESISEQADKELKKVRMREKVIMKKLNTQATTDDLTKMYNRRYFTTITPSIINTARRENEYLTFFIIDIDFFKNYNDYYGHQAGDEALQKVAQVLIEFMHRRNDFVFRLGGEEFAGLINSKNIEQTHRWLTTLLETVASLEIEHLKTKLDKKVLTISCGAFTTKANKNTNVNILYKIGDKALYQAKESGRNKIVFINEG
ncbi:GGDEF domain-containing protein [Sulfurimonas sp.]|uniref:GGDEF domain-containing protein n=1 Tax=Sulfurimonas sp. TaxID=2022749 RepID=UPI002630B8D3|nr:GGDEF domain-containing protein [Sulfurimonas sp.]